MGKRKLGRAARVLLFPALALVFLVGWCMYMVGSHKRAGTERKKVKADGVTFLPVIFEDREIIEDQKVHE